MRTRVDENMGAHGFFVSSKNKNKSNDYSSYELIQQGRDKEWMDNVNIKDKGLSFVLS